MKIPYMMKIIYILISILLYCAASIFSQSEYELSQKDIDEFLSFADAYKEAAAPFVKNTALKSVSEIFYNTDDEKWITFCHLM
jgi:hypothetical protein